MKARILVIDDEPAIRDSMRMILEYDGHEVALAASGQEGLALAERDPPDLVFLDIKMPGMDGLEVLSRLRAHQRRPARRHDVGARHGGDGARGRADSARSGFIEKPLSKDYVLDAVREGARTGHAAAREPDAASRRSRCGIR